MSDPIRRQPVPPPPVKKAGPGGTEGGLGVFIFGFILSAVALWLFFDSVRMVTEHGGILGRRLGRALGGAGGGGNFTTTSMGIIFLPLFVGMIMLFNNARNKIGWVVLLAGVAVLVIEMISMVRFQMEMKTSSFVLMMGVFAAGLGMMLRSYRSFAKAVEDQDRAAG